MERAGIVTELGRHQVSHWGDEVALTPTGYRLLELMMRRPGKALTREYVLGHVWDGYYGSSKKPDVHIRRLREKLEAGPSRPRLIKTVRCTGHRLDRPEEG